MVIVVATVAVGVIELVRMTGACGTRVGAGLGLGLRVGAGVWILVFRVVYLWSVRE